MNAVVANQDATLFHKVLRTLHEAQRRWLVGREALRYAVVAAPIAYQTGGQQRIAIAAGGGLFVFGL